MSSDLEAALDGAGVGVWSWVVGTAEVRWSSRIEHIFGVAPGTFAGTFEAYLEVIHPDDVDRVKAAIEQSLAPGAPHYLLEHRISPQGKVRWLECRGQVERDASGAPRRMLGTVVDVTVRKEAQQAMERSAEAIALVGELANDYVYLLERDDLAQAVLLPRIVAGSFERVVGMTPDEVRARGGWPSVIHPEDRAQARSTAALLRKGQPLISEYRIVDGTGQTRWLRDTVRPLVEGGELVRVAGGVKEITREKELEQQFLQAQKLDALARLAGGVAHDFNNVLAVIQSGIDVVARRTSGPHDPVLDDVRDATQRAAELTRGLLSFARKPLGPPQVLGLDTELGALRPVLARALGDRHRLHFEALTEGLSVRMEAGQLQVLLLNLVINARDAMPGGGQVVVSAQPLVLEAGDRRRPANLAPGRYFVIEVRDTGLGMGHEVLTHLFEPFFTTKGPRGTGLGLASCHGIALRAGGGLTVHSVLKAGSTFTVVLPLADGHPAPSPPQQVSVGGTECLLLVEDEPALRRVARRALMDRGYTVLEAGSAEQALALTAEQLSPVQLVVSDVGLPGMDGARLVRELVGRVPGLRVLLMSGYLPDQQAEAAVERGELSFLAKPFSGDGLARRVREVLDA